MKNNLNKTASLIIALLGILFSVAYISPKISVANTENTLPGITKDAVIICIDSVWALVNGNKINIYNNKPGITPVLVENKTYAPVSFLIDHLGMNKNEIKQNVTIKSINGIDYASVRMAAETLNKEIFYDNGLIVISQKNMLDSKKDRAIIDQVASELSALPVIGSAGNLIKLIGKPKSQDTFMLSKGMPSDSVLESTSDFAAGAPAASSEPVLAYQAADSARNETASTTGETDYSKTNVQVQGVDEGDIIKTDGQYIYYVRDKSISVVKAKPASDMKLEYTINLDDEYSFIHEIYQDGDNLVVISNGSRDMIVSNNRPGLYFGYLHSYSTNVSIYDISDKTNIKKVRELATEGEYVSSRKIGSSVYLVSSNPVYNLINGDTYVKPSYKDTAIKDSFINIEYDKIHYFPHMNNQTYTTIMGFMLDKPEQEASISTFLGGGDNIYVSNDNMYIATMSDYNNAVPLNNSSLSSAKIRGSYYDRKTTVYKFALKNGEATLKSKGQADGNILNQFSMDEYNGNLRIATTSYDDRSEQRNNLYVFNGDMRIIGKIENIAPGERIYSTRFMGDRGYMVTFKTVDPLFAIDLKDPYNPVILGALKIPGYSDYLHPYDENYLIGFGKDTTVVKGNAYYKGMKISMFDVTDVTNPKELFVEIIGDRGTDSEVLNNHRALLFSKEKNLLAFPVGVYTVLPEEKNNELSYGVFDFQGAYVYNIDMSKGFNLVGKLTHLDKADNLKAGMYDGDYSKYIRRLLYIGDDLYTLSNSMIKANSLKDLSEKGSVKLD